MVENLLRKSVRDLRASLAQTIALIVIVALGIASFVALIGAYRDLGTSYNHTYEQLHFADATFSVQDAPQSVVAQVAGVDGVAAVTGRLIVDGGLEVC
jgi:putative ABC transport system permease protein